MNGLMSLARPEIVAMQAYRSARSEYTGQQMVQLDANESPTPPFGANTSVHRYPEPQPEMLRNKLASIYGVHSRQLLMTRGMDEGIDLLMRVFCRPYQDKLCISPPTFGYYAVAANLNAVGITRCPLLAGFEPDWQALMGLKDHKMIFLCNPNNPTGNLSSLDNIEQLCLAQAGRCLVVVDEAYIEFSGQASATILLNRCDNLVVLRTLSKAYALAGARIGVAIASEAIIALLQKIIPPYPLPSPCVSVALDALSPVGLAHSHERLSEIITARDHLFEQLQTLPGLIAIYPSVANFILLQLEDAALWYQRLKAKGILVRDRSADLPNSLRITVGNASENTLLLVAFGLTPTYTKPDRRGRCDRRTNETAVLIDVCMNDLGKADIDTGIGYFDHMLEQIARHSGVSLYVRCEGDLQVDEHHTIEDVALSLGTALKDALGDKKGIQRYGFVLPMDESQAEVSLDLSGRGVCLFDAQFPIPRLGDFPTEMVGHFFSSLAQTLGAAIHIKVRGDNTHHMVESAFKCMGRTLKQAIVCQGEQLPSSKGVL